MADNLTGLQAIYTALGGENAAILTNNADALAAIAALLADGNFGILPNVSSSDNGKVLTVQSGSWKKVKPTPELPAVSSDDNNKVLTVVSGEWAAANLPE